MTEPRAFPTSDELHRHIGWLRRLAARLVGEGGADDLAQETWLAAWRHRPERPSPWLRRVLRNRAAGDARALSRQRAREAAHARPEALPSTADLAARAEATRLLVEAVQRLEPAQRDVILMHYFDELPPAAIAERLGIPGSTVRSHLARGLARLRRDLDAASGDPTRWSHALTPLAATTAAGHTSLLRVALQMTTTHKLSAGVIVALLGLGIVSWRYGIEPAERATRPDERVQSTLAAGGTGGAGDAMLPQENAEGRGSEKEPVRRPEAPPRVETQRIQVVHATTGEAVPHATVLYTAAGFVWAQLDPRAKEMYSRSTELFLREHGESQEADDEGYVDVPILAATHAVAGRKGDLYGSRPAREGEKAWTLSLSQHSAFAVEVVDTHGVPVAGIRIDCERFPRLRWTLGTTDENGIVTHVFETPAATEGPPDVLRMWTVYASLPSGGHGSFALDPAAPPGEPVRIVLPATGTVTVRILDPSGSPLDPRLLADPNVELVPVEPDAPMSSGLAVHMRTGRHRARIDAEGDARFTNVILGKTLSIEAPTLLEGPVTFRGPREGEVDVLVEHQMHPDHPMLVGRLVGPDQRPLANTRFSVMCRSGTELLSAVPGITDDHGNFATYLSAKATGAAPTESTFGIGPGDPLPTRAVGVKVSGPLTWKVPVGDVVMPER